MAGSQAGEPGFHKFAVDDITGTGETTTWQPPGEAVSMMQQPAVVHMSIPMRYAVLLRDLRLSVPVFDDTATFNAEEFSAIFGALKGLRVRMVNFEHQLDKIEVGMSKLEHRIDRMVNQLQHADLDDDDDDDGDGGLPVTTACPPAHRHHHADEMSAQHFYLKNDHQYEAPTNANFPSNNHQYNSQTLLVVEPV